AGRGKHGTRICWSGKKREFGARPAGTDGKTNQTRRLQLAPRAEAIRKQAPPLLPVAWERINEIWYNQVKGLNPAAYFGIFDVVRLDTVWLDKATTPHSTVTPMVKLPHP